MKNSIQRNSPSLWNQVLLVASLLGSTAVASAATVSDVLVRQQWPWSAKVNVDYRLTAEVDEVCDMTLSYIGPDGTEVEVDPAHLSGDVESVPSGERRIVWDAVASGLSGKSAAVRVVLAPKAAYGRKYMVVDLSKPATDGAEADYPVSYLDEVPAGGWTDAHKSTKLVLRRIPAGKFTMGSPDTEPFHEAPQEWQREITLTEDFYIGVFPVTEKQWKRVMGERGFWSGDCAVACNLTWTEIRGANIAAEDTWPHSTTVSSDGFLHKLRTHVTGTLPSGYVFDLPTEAQWEYACRAGTTGAWNNGTDISVDESGRDVNLDKLGVYVVDPDADGWVIYGVQPPFVGTKMPNSWGLFDMHGGILEWCLDYLSANISELPTVNPRGPDIHVAGYRILRGGCWRMAAKYARSAHRSYSLPESSTQYNITGFRLALIREVTK